MADFTLRDHGSVVILTPNTELADDWVADKLSPDILRWGQKGVVIEPRYAAAAVADIQVEGMIIEEVSP